jgi:catechol 2,3-dioxygenase-like lactoylglutathione lyase family enzyme
MAEEPTTPNQQPAVSIKYIYVYVNEIDAMRHFYTDLVGLDEGAYRNDEKWGWLTYNCGSLEFMCFRAVRPLPVPEEFAAQPGWEGGQLPSISWSVSVPEAQFTEAVQRLKSDGVKSFAEQPFWAQDSYWSFPVLDPMGNTVELFCEVKERPASTEWPA